MMMTMMMITMMKMMMMTCLFEFSFIKSPKNALR